jgi:aminoglycoside 3-N-acetyltransferase I
MAGAYLRAASQVTPMDITIKHLTATDYPKLIELLDVYKEAFGLTEFNLPSADYLHGLLSHPTMLFNVAIRSGKVVGGLTAFTMPSVYYPGSELYIYDFAIRPAFQREGIGSALLKDLRAWCTRNGIKEIFVQADRPDRHAIEFYKKNGGIPEDVIHFSFPC